MNATKKGGENEETVTESPRGDSGEVALLRRFLAGEKLPAAEMAQLDHLLPVSVLSAPPRPRAGYRHDLGHYAAAVKCNVRTLKRWISVGKSAQPPLLPPLDEPPAMLSWWGRLQALRLIKQRPPQILLDYARVEAPATAAAAAPAPSGTPTSGATAKATDTFVFSGAAGGLAESVIELRSTLAATQRRLKSAMLANPIDEGLVTSCQRSVAQGLDLLRKAESDLFEMQKKRGDLVPLKDVREDWSTLLMSLRMMRGRMVDNICGELAGGFTPEQVEKIRAAVTLEREREEQLLRGAKHWKEEADVSPVAV